MSSKIDQWFWWDLILFKLSYSLMALYSSFLGYVAILHKGLKIIVLKPDGR